MNRRGKPLTTRVRSIGSSQFGVHCGVVERSREGRRAPDSI